MAVEPTVKKSENKKSAPKKSTAKKSSKKASKKSSAQVKQKVFKKIPADKYFVLANGQKVDHYVTLANLLGDLEEDIIKHHVSEIHHDFANWVKDVFDEEDLAEKIRVVKEPEQIRLVIYRHVIDKHLS